MSADEKLLDVQHVTVEFHIGGLLASTLLIAVNDISFSLDSDRPEILTLAGESGSGKTTLSRLLLRDLVPTRGKVLFEGRDLAKIHKSGRVQRLHEESPAGVPESIRDFQSFASGRCIPV